MSWTKIPTDAIDRIVRSVEPTVMLVRTNGNVVGPPDPNKDLSYRLHQSLMWYYVARERRSDAKKKREVRSLAAISQTASKLLNLLKPDQGWGWLNTHEFEVLTHALEISLPAAKSKIYDLEMKIQHGDDFGTEYDSTGGRDLRDLIRKRSPFEWLAGAYLADDYRVCFGKEPTLQRGTEGQLGGPYVQFVEQVLVEFGVKKGPGRPFGREAIAKALTNVRKGGYTKEVAAARSWLREATQMLHELKKRT
jgi:hypothetical protein